MFKDNKYTKCYYRLVNKRKNEQLSDNLYTENHHIIPKCLGGSDDTSNIVTLTAREHFIAHLLLIRMCDNQLLKYALFMMTVSNNNHNRYKCTSRTYAYLKGIMANATSKRMRGISYNKGKIKYYNVNTFEERLFKPDETVGSEWVKGSLKMRKPKGTKGYKYYHDGEGNVRLFSDISLVPDGWVKGNPNANSSSINNIRGSEYYYCPLTGECKRFQPSDVPDGWVKGNSYIWITNGKENRKFNNFINNNLPTNWRKGRTIKKLDKNNQKCDVMTPFGKYNRHNFCDEFGIDISFFSKLDNKIKIRESNKKLIQALELISYDFKKSKLENGFYFI